MAYNIEQCIVDYTGGNIFVVRGKLSDGSYFIAEDSNFDIRLVNANPLRARNWEYADWQEKHLIKDLHGSERVNLFRDILNYCIESNRYEHWMTADLERLTNDEDSVMAANEFIEDSNISDDEFVANYLQDIKDSDFPVDTSDDLTKFYEDSNWDFDPANIAAKFAESAGVTNSEYIDMCTDALYDIKAMAQNEYNSDHWRVLWNMIGIMSDIY